MATGFCHFFDFSVANSFLVLTGLRLHHFAGCRVRFVVEVLLGRYYASSPMASSSVYLFCSLWMSSW